MPKPLPEPKTRADVLALPIPTDSKSVLHWALDQPARVYEREEVATALGIKPAAVEIAVVKAQRRWPFVFSAEGPDGDRLTGGKVYIGDGHPCREAWEVDPGPRSAPRSNVMREPVPADSYRAGIVRDANARAQAGASGPQGEEIAAYNKARAAALNRGMSERDAKVEGRRAAELVRKNPRAAIEKQHQAAKLDPDAVEAVAFLRELAEGEEGPLDVLVRMMRANDEIGEENMQLREALTVAAPDDDVAMTLEAAAHQGARAIVAAVERQEHETHAQAIEAFRNHVDEELMAHADAAEQLDAAAERARATESEVQPLTDTPATDDPPRIRGRFARRTGASGGTAGRGASGHDGPDPDEAP